METASMIFDILRLGIRAFTQQSRSTPRKQTYQVSEYDALPQCKVKLTFDSGTWAMMAFKIGHRAGISALTCTGIRWHSCILAFLTLAFSHCIEHDRIGNGIRVDIRYTICQWALRFAHWHSYIMAFSNWHSLICDVHAWGYWKVVDIMSFANGPSHSLIGIRILLTFFKLAFAYRYCKQSMIQIGQLEQVAEQLPG